MKLIAVPTQDQSGLRGKIAEVLSRAETLTMVTIDNGELEVIEILVNPFFSDIHGSGPLFAQYLHEREVSTVVTKNAGPGVKAQLKSRNIQLIINSDLVRVKDIIDIYRGLTYPSVN